jgi:hypothetical protein
MALHVGDVGAVIRLTIYEDGAAKNISAASAKQIHIRKPDGSVLVKTATFTTSGSDGQLEAATESGDLDDRGQYRAAAYMTLGSWTGFTSPAKFEVALAP